MKNFKRILALVLTLMFIVGSCASLSAYSGATTTSWYSKAVSWIEDAGVDTVGATADETIDRETFVKWVAKIESTYVDDALWKDEVASTTFDDVTEENYKAAIAYSQQRGFIRGYDAKTFGPKDVLTFAQACAVIVRVLGAESYVEEMDDDRWEYNYINIANKLGAIDSIWVANVGFYVPAHEMTKGEAAYLLWLAAQTAGTTTPNDWPEGHAVLGHPGDFKLFGNLDHASETVYAVVAQLNRAPIAGNSGTDTSGWKTRITNRGSNSLLMRYSMTSATYSTEDKSGTPGWYQNKYATQGTDSSCWVDPSWIIGEPAMADYWAQYELSEGVYDIDAILKIYRLPYSKDIITKTLVPSLEAAGHDAEEADVVLAVFDGTKSFGNTSITYDGDEDITGAEEFQALIRKGLGLSEKVGDTETFSLFDYVQEGSVVKITTNKKTGKQAITVVDNHVVDTYRVLSQTTSLAVYNAGLANTYNASSAKNSLVLRSSYDETKDVTSWDGDKLTIGGKEYTILTPGKEYSGAQNELMVIDATYGNFEQVKAKDAKTLIINAVEGEVVTVYTDMDGDGYYDVAVVTESAAFKFSTTLNAKPASDFTIKGIPSLGTVVLNATVDSDFNCGNTDPFSIDESRKTGKMQLVLMPSDARHIAGFFDTTKDMYSDDVGLRFNLACLDPDTHVADLAAFQTGYIKNASSKAVDGYYTLTITTADGDVTAKIPAIGSIAIEQDMDVEAFGAKTTYTLASKGWMNFLTDFYSANFQYDFVDKDGKYIYNADGETTPYASESLEIVAYYKGKTITTYVPATTATPKDGVNYKVATPVDFDGTSFASDVDYYEKIVTYTPAVTYASTTEYYRVTATEWADAKDSLISWKDGVQYATKDDETASKHLKFTTTPSDWDGQKYKILSGTEYVTATTFDAAQTYYIDNPQAYTAVDTSAAPKFASIASLWVLDGDTYRPATYTDFTFTFNRNVNYYDENGNLINTSAYESGTDYYTADAPTYAEHSEYNELVKAPADPKFFTMSGNTYTAVAAGTTLDPSKTYYTLNPQTYSKVTITEFDPNETYYIHSGTEYVEVEQLATVDPTATINTISDTDYEYVGLVSESDFVTDTDFYFVTREETIDLSAIATEKEDGKYYVSFELATEASALTSFVADTYYFEEVNDVVEKTLVTQVEKDELLADDATNTDFVTLTRWVKPVLGYTDDLADGEKALITYVGAQDGVFEYQSKEDIDKRVSAWMANQYVDFVVDEDGVIIVSLSTEDKSKEVEGFVVSAVKGTDNTYTVTLAKTGTALKGVSTYYATDMSLADLKATKNSGTTMVAGTGYATDQDQSDTLDPNTYGRKFSYFGETADAVAAELKAAFEANKNAGAIWFSAYGANAGYLELDNVTEEHVQSFLGVSSWAEATAKIISGEVNNNLKGSVGAAVFTVRASASSIWDSANNASYRKIYGGEVVTGLAEGNAITQNNLIYVSMTKDGGDYSIMRVITPGTGSTSTAAIGQQVITNKGITGSKSWAYGLTMASTRVFQFVGYYKGTVAADEASEEAWHTDGITVLLSSTKNAAASIAKSKDNSTVYTEVYDEQIATDAEYYVHGGKFDVKFATVGTRTKTITYTPVVDKIVGGRYVLVTDAEGNALKADSDAGKAALADAEYVNINGTVHWELIPGEYKYAGKYTSVTTYSGVTATGAGWLSDYELDDAQRATMNLITSISAMKREDKGYIPGYYFVTIDGTTYTSAGSTKVIIMTPSNEEGKVVGQVTTLKDLAENKSILFATRYQIAATGKNLTALTVIGELVGEAPVHPTPVDTTKIVYLGCSAETVLEAEEVGTSYFVRTSTPAYNLDGTEFGYIYREYNTTSAEFSKTVANNEFNFILGNSGCFFKVSAEGKILEVLGSLYETKTSAAFKEVVNGEQISYTYDYTALKNTLSSAVFKTATITSVENGKILATVGSAKNVNIADWNVKFVYTDVDGEQLFVAGNNTAVSIFSFDVAIENALTSAYKKDGLARETAKKYSTGYSAETKKAYADAYAEAAAALATAKTAALDKYFNGAFWGTGAVENTPVASYFTKVKDSFGRTASLAFNYVQVGDVYYVIVPTFVLG